MRLKLVNERTGAEFIEHLQKKYESISNLKRLIEKDTENLVYILD